MDRVCVHKLQCVSGTVLDTLRISAAEVALEDSAYHRVVRDIAERTCIGAHLTADTFVVVDDDRIVLIPGDRTDRTYLHAGRIVALQAHHRDGDSCLLILEYMNIGKLRIEFAEMAEGASQFTSTAADAFFRLND